MAEGCKTCKQKGPSNVQYGIIILGFYILSTAVYGTITLIENLINYFK